MPTHRHVISLGGALRLKWGYAQLCIIMSKSSDYVSVSLLLGGSGMYLVLPTPVFPLSS